MQKRGEKVFGKKEPEEDKKDGGRWPKKGSDLVANCCGRSEKKRKGTEGQLQGGR